jgi:fatty acid desaturase
MLPPADLLPAVLPSERLTASGKALPPIRSGLRRISDIGTAWTIVSLFGQTLAVVCSAVWLSHPVAWVVAFLLMGRAFAQFAILAHEAAHRLLFSNRTLNDFVGRWVLGAPAFVPLEAYRRGHIAHHRDEFGPDEPDMNLYRGYPITPASFGRKLRRDAFGNSGWKNLKGLLLAFRSPTARPIVIRIVAAQAVLLAVAAAFGRPELWLFLWLAPWMTVWRVINRLRSIAEHGGMERSSDRRRTTHVVRQRPLARFFMVPYNTGWHLAHHVDMGVPWRNLPAMHAELVRAGYVVDALEYSSYRALWRTLASGA